MKSAEEWFNNPVTGEGLHNMVCSPEADYDENVVITLLKQIQLDAWKQGMQDAATLAEEGAEAYLTLSPTLQSEAYAMRDVGKNIILNKANRTKI